MEWEDYIMPKKISGPVSLSLYQFPKGDKMIYMFGDVHLYTEGCEDNRKSISRVIKDILELFPERVDFYLETIPKLMCFTKEEQPKSYLSELINSFQDCFHPKDYGKICEFKDRHRFHYIDLRLLNPKLFKVKNNASDYISKFQVFLMYQDKYRKLKSMKNRSEDMNQMLSYLEASDKKLREYNKNVVSLTDDLFKIFKIDKQLADIDEKERTIILDVFKVKLSNFEKYNIKEGESLCDEIKYALDFLCLFMDIYSVSRMFRNFKGDYPKNILVYTGRWHAVDFQDYFIALGGIPVFGELTERDRKESREDIVIANIKQCVDTTGLDKWFTRK